MAIQLTPEQEQQRIDLDMSGTERLTAAGATVPGSKFLGLVVQDLDAK